MNFTLAAKRTNAHTSGDVPQFLLLSSSPNLYRDDLQCRFVFDDEEEFEGVIVVDGHDIDDVAAIVRRSNNSLLPVANLSDAVVPFADFSDRSTNRGRLQDAVEALMALSGSIRRLPESIRLSDDAETVLLARTYTRGGFLSPTYDPSVSRMITYPVAGLSEEPWRHADRLTEAGLLHREFFDRLHCCPSCGSSRLNVREECPACRSPDLADETIIHHFRCAHQAPERQFVQGDKLVCPKCTRELRHFGVDYDKPGLTTACRSCGHVSAESLVGFVCFDCASRHDSQAMATRDWFEYKITAAGRHYLLSKQANSASNDRKDAPSTFNLMVKQGIRLHTRYGKPLTILRVSFARAEQVRRQHGEYALSQARTQALEIVRGEMRDTDVVLDTEDGILVYLPETAPDQTETPLRRLADRIGTTLRVDLGAETSLVTDEELVTLLPA